MSRTSSERILAVILNETRAHEFTYELFRSNFLDVLNADLAVYVADNHREDKGNPFYQDAEYVWDYPEPGDWADAVEYAQSAGDVDGYWTQVLSIRGPLWGAIKAATDHPGAGVIGLFGSQHRLPTQEHPSHWTTS